MDIPRECISVLIGQRIKQFRKDRKMTIESLSSAINKSTSTVSKYENGSIAIDVETLLDISNALNVDICRLVDYPTKQHVVSVLPGNPFRTTLLYLYQYDGRVKRIVRSLLQLAPGELNDGLDATFFLNIPSFEEYNQCKYVYKGPVYCYDTFIHFLLSNPYNSSGRVAISTINPYWLDHLNTPTLPFWGILIGISFHPFGPFASKVMLSKTPREENDELKSQLLLSKEDIRKIKYYNLLMVDI
jgi:transcriptional regulator with XRE-family HTH domain